MAQLPPRRSWGRAPFDRLSGVKVLVVGPGGREHAIVRALLRDAAVTTVEAAPGNAGIAAQVRCHRVDAQDPAAVSALAVAGGFDLVVIGPEAPLAAGVADAVREAGIPAFGPSAAAARLEASKAFAKEIMAAAQVPTAGAVHVSDLAGAQAAVERFGAPYVIKDDGLAAGKGVVVTEDRAEALAHAQACFAAGGTVVIEEFLDGPEVSLFVLSDGANLVPLSPAQDFKRIFNDDAGPNTGGMGAYTPLDWLTGYTETDAAGTERDFVQIVVDTVAAPTLAEMSRRGTPFVGVLYCGLAVTSRGVRVIEFNARFGDPETQAVLERLATPLGQLLLDCSTGSLGPARTLEWAQGYAADVVMAAENYPESPRRGDVITGTAEAESLEGVAVLHAGTAADGQGRLTTSGGRVLAVVGTGVSLAEAVERAYAGVQEISWPGEQHRTDIAAKALAGEIRLSPETRPDADTQVSGDAQPRGATVEELPGWVHASSGKVRELYRPAPGSPWDGQDVVLMVASDRISAYDHVLGSPIPDKGIILTQLSLWWFDQLEAAGISHHVVSVEVPEAVAGRAMICRNLQMVEAECIARGYLTGSGLAEYRESGTVTGLVLPEGLTDGSQLPEPIFTPSSKAAQGDHDENISFETLAENVGAELAVRLREATLRIYVLAEEICRDAGVILADTKLEFGFDPAGALTVADEVLTPDSSRFWPAESWAPGAAQPSFDKQFVRDWLTSAESGWDRNSGQAPPALPQEVVEATRQRYLDAYQRLTGTELLL
ncbi:phosphoribosylaminoimidazole-succinocarboxamide synthase /phosphoribosylamine--glycine ligase [Nesterenkonia sandarakina]|uniref:Multifunctional fusion protein n=1 Tax=Nesterenkonia sandarakina TaxID=272918 RepID=A0A2T0YGV1_9MICC|nr:phosphoribosylaminoimidazole-succinocarboxamide synthase /phosphoribosylamine--glycine ligase [Nesterenkonia sandarakina]